MGGHPGGGGGRRGRRSSLAEDSEGGGSSTTAASVAGGSGKDGQSSGDSTRREFFNLLFLALLSRFLLLPIQAFYFAPSSHHIHPETGLCMKSPACIFSRTFPDMCFASAFSLLVLFYAQLAGTASGGALRGLSYFLTRWKLFQTCNIAVYGIYSLLFIFTAFVPHVPYALFQTCIWSMLCLIYATLLGTLAYFGPVLLSLLRPSLATRSALALRLSATCIVCAAVFLSRTILFAIAVYETDYRWTHGIANTDISDADYKNQFNENVLGYTLLELLPSVIILTMMHQRSPRSMSSQSPSAAAGTTPPGGLSPAGMGGGYPPGRLSPKGGGGGSGYDRGPSATGSIRRSLSGSAAQGGGKRGTSRGLGVEGLPLLDDRGGGGGGGRIGSGYGSAAAALSGS